MTELPRVVLSDRYFEAVSFASRIHADHTRKDTTLPYVCHLLAVSASVLEAGGDEEQAIAGLLHDAAEDCGGEPCLAEIRRIFGARVADIVLGCSDSLTEDPELKEAWKLRKKRHLNHLKSASADVAMVTAADKLHNVRAINVDIRIAGVAYLDRFNASPNDLVWYYETLAEILHSLSAPLPLVVPLQEEVVLLRSLAAEAVGREVMNDVG